MSKGKNKKVIWLVKDELGKKIDINFVGLREKSYLIDGGSENKKCKRHKKVCNKKKTLNLRSIKTFSKQLNLRIN